MINLNACDKILDIETRYPVEDIEYNGIKIWPFIRIFLFFKLFNKGDAIKSKRKQYLNIFCNTIKSIRILPLMDILKKKRVILFAHSFGSELKLIDGIYIDRFFNEIINLEENILPIVLEDKLTYQPIFQKYVNISIIYTIIYSLSLIIKIKKIKMKNVDILIDINSELGININIYKKIIQIYCSIIVYKALFKFIRPSKLYQICYYNLNTMAASYAAKKFNIPVIEIQHGIIHPKHAAYITNKNIKENPYPNYFFSFSDIYKEIISSSIYERENIFLTGYYYIELIKKRKKQNYEMFKKKYGKYENNIKITIAGQVGIEKDIIMMMKSIVKINTNIIFIYIPRKFTSEIKKHSSPNLIIEDELDVYQCIQNTQITSTVFSTVAIESLVFGTPVILLNINNLAKDCFSKLFSSTKSVYYADTPDEYVNIISKAISMDRNQVVDEGECFYADNHREKIKKAINEISKR